MSSENRKTRKRLTDKQIEMKFQTNRRAEKWFIEVFYGSREEMFCPRCGSTRVKDIPKRKPMPFYCRDCRKFFSVRTGTVMAKSRLPLWKWAKNIYKQVYHLRGMPAVVTMNELGVAKNTAWFLNHRIRKAFENNVTNLREKKFKGEVEVDETFVGGVAANMKPSTKERFKERGGGQGGAGKQIVIAARERETGKVVSEVIEDRTKETLQGFVESVTDENATILTDEAKGYKGMNRDHRSVNHSAGEYSKQGVNVAGVESQWATLKRGINGNFFAISPKHTRRYVMEFSGRHNNRPLDTEEQIKELAKGMIGIRLTYADLTADNGMDNFARPVKGSVWDLKRIRKNKVKAERKALRRMGKPRKLPLVDLQGGVYIPMPGKQTSDTSLEDDYIPY